MSPYQRQILAEAMAAAVKVARDHETFAGQYNTWQASVDARQRMRDALNDARAVRQAIQAVAAGLDSAFATIETPPRTTAEEVMAEDAAMARAMTNSDPISAYGRAQDAV